MSYEEEDYLQLSGLQHFCFCRRQWALIHIENLWQENLLTAEGKVLHERAHDETFKEKRGSLMIVRGVRISSSTLGVSGQCDVLEYRADQQGITLPGIEGRWQPYPVEYKRGKPKDNASDRLQLCGQAICLEEMLCCDIPKGAIFYGEIRRREEVAFTPEMREQVFKSLTEMHALYSKGYTPKVKPSKACNSCSLKEQCLPKLMRKRPVADYLSKSIKDSE
jgi:CRISPR-associated exonuclease Cas4